MGLWSTLGKIGMIAGPIAAMPFTGGTSLLSLLGASAKTAATIGGIAGAAGTVASGVAQGRAKGRADEAGLQSLIAERQNQSTIDASKLKLAADAQRSRQLVGADLSESWKPIADPRMAPFGTPQGLSPETINFLKSRATNALTSGSDVPQMQTPTMPQPGKTDSILSGLGYGGQIAGVMDEWRKRNPVVAPTTPGPAPYGNVGQVQFPAGSMRF